MNILLQTPPRPPSIPLLRQAAARPYSALPRAASVYRPYRSPAETLRRMLDVTARYFAMPLPEKKDDRE